MASKNLFRDLRSIERDEASRIALELAREGSEASIFTAQETQDFVNEEVGFFTGRRGKTAIQARVIYDPRYDVIGVTDHDTILVNAGHELVADYTELSDRVMAVSGVLYHEIAHCLYLDIEKKCSYISALEAGKMIGNLPVVSGLDVARLRAMLLCVQEPDKYYKLFATLFAGFSNCISDEHDEACFIRDHGSYPEQCIIKNKAKLGMGVSTYEIMMEALAQGNTDPISVATDLILQTARFGYVYSTDPASMEQDSVYQEVVAPVRDKILEATKPTASFDDIIDCCNELIFHMFKLIMKNQEEQEKQNQQQNGTGKQQNGSQSSSGNQNGNQQIGAQSGCGNQNENQQNGSGNQQQNGQSQSGAGNPGNMSQQEINRLVQQIQSEISKITGKTPNLSDKAQKECQSAASKAGNKPGINAGDKSGYDAGDKAKEEAKEFANDLVKRIIEARAEKAASEITTNEIIELARDVGVSSTHRGVPLNVTRRLDIANSGKSDYEKITKEQKTILNVMLKRMKTAFKDMQTGNLKKHQVFGNSFVAADAYRLDGCAFSSKKNRNNDPDISIAVLVDESGSMTAPKERILSAQKTAILLYNFCRTLDIPIMVCGHQTGFGTNFHIYSDFRPVRDDNYRVAAGISAAKCGGCNRDGHAIQVAGGLLISRPEPVKLLMIISDGQPNDTNYRGLEAERDIKETVQKLTRRGVSTIAFAIGSDKDRIKEIYGERYVDISDLSTMPKTLCKIVSKAILASVNK